MNRDELLTKLAMDLAEWPDADRTYYHYLPDPWFWQWSGLAPKERVANRPTHPSISMSDWLAERERLIKKPGWEGAPEDATHLAQSADGLWLWLCKETGDPIPIGSRWHCDGASYARIGRIPVGHDWKETLEQRPTECPSEDRIESIGQNGPSGDHYEDDKFRQCERRLREAELEADVSACTRCDELASQLKTSRRDYEVMNKLREGAEADRAALSAYVERLASALRWHRAIHDMDHDPELLKQAHAEMEAALCDSPKTSLAALKAQWQAEVATRIFCDLEAEFDPCHPIIKRVEHIESEYLSQAGGDV